MSNKNDKKESNIIGKVYDRPWGNYTSLIHGKNYQVKVINVNPHSRLSLQLHNRRAEHWVMVSGTLRITVGEEEIILSEGESVYIEMGMTHRAENETSEIATVIEVQTGSYLGEDDIVRICDDYGRVE